MGWFHAALAHFGERRPGTMMVLGSSLWMAVGLLLFTAGPAQAKVLVTDLAFTARSDGQGYVVRVRTTKRPGAYLIDPSVGKHQLKLVLYNTALHESYEKGAPKGPVTRYTTTRQDGHLIIRLFLAENRSVSAAAYRDRASDDLLLSLTYKGSAPVAEASSNPASSTEGPGRPGPMRETRRHSRLDTIVVDPGHGGRDPGAVANGLKEKNIVLDVALKLGHYIEDRLDIEVVYTRTKDRFIPLEERGHFANRVGGDLFISLHANAFRSAAVKGTETYFLGRSKTDAARRVMRRENSVVRQYEKNPDRYDEYDIEAFVKGELFLSASMRFSEQFASLVQSQFERRLQRRNRGVHQAGFYVLWSASMPSVLVELGFLTNPQEARYLASDRGQTKLAKAIFRAVRKYEKKYEKQYKGGVAASE